MRILQCYVDCVNLLILSGTPTHGGRGDVEGRNKEEQCRGDAAGCACITSVYVHAMQYGTVEDGI
jgi:hypothetical protein